jgi:hypothetical protein
MTGVFFRRERERRKKRGTKHPVVASVLLSIKLPVIFWDSLLFSLRSVTRVVPQNLCSFLDLILFFRVKYVTSLNDTFPTTCSLYIRQDVEWHERERNVKSGTIHFKMLVFIALVSWTFACGYTNVCFMTINWCVRGLVAPWISPPFFYDVLNIFLTP